MFGFISKKKLRDYIEDARENNRASKLGQNYDQPISEEQHNKNLYAQGYEDGTDNLYNAIRHKFKI